MKKIIYLSIAAAVTFMMASCNNLDTQDLTHKNTTNYPATYSDAQSMITGIYGILNVLTGYNYEGFFMIASLASDDQFGGGGANDYTSQAEDLMLSSGPEMLNDSWSAYYQGIYRANYAIETLDNCMGYPSDDAKNQLKGEAYFMRAFYYYELASLFENVPMVLTTELVNNPQATPDEMWGQIISDLKQAITLMPNKKFNSGFIEAGHADKWTAEAMLARAFLFYTGFYNKTDVTLPDGSTVSKSDVSGYVDDCVNNSGYSLVSDYRELWAYTNRCTVESYPYTAGQKLAWVENDNDINPESMFAIKYSKFPSYNSGSTTGFSNQYCTYFGIRSQPAVSNGYPFGSGWGWGPVSPALWSDWVAAEPNDIRRAASICNIPDELPKYAIGCAGNDTYIQETDYFEKKLGGIMSPKADGSGYWGTFEMDMYSFSQGWALGSLHDLVLIRFADVLLMQSELEQNVSGINKVRTRAKLQPVAAYSDVALQNERRWELAFEGVRWNDIRRWHIAETVLAGQATQRVYINGVAKTNTTSANGGGYLARYQATKGGFFPIPESQIALSEGVLKQNAGWGTGAELYAGWR